MADKDNNKSTVRLKLGPASWPVDHFDAAIEGVPVLSFDEYQDVPAGQEQAVRDAAKANGVTISREG